MSVPTIVQLQRAIQISERIQQLEAELVSVLGGLGASGGKTADNRLKAKRRGRPPENKGLLEVKLAGHEINGDVTPAKKGRKKRRGISAEGRAKIAAAQKARWAKVKG